MNYALCAFCLLMRVGRSRSRRFGKAWKQTTELVKLTWKDNTPACQCVSSLEVIWLFILLLDAFHFFFFNDWPYLEGFFLENIQQQHGGTLGSIAASQLQALWLNRELRLQSVEFHLCFGVGFFPLSKYMCVISIL